MPTMYSPKVVTDGMVLYFDVANKKSYPGTGSMLYNIVDKTITGSFVGSVTYINEFAGGSLTFASSYVNIGTPPQLLLQVPLTICGWFRQTTVNTYGPIYAAYDQFATNRLQNLVRLDSGVFTYHTSKTTGTYQTFNTNFSPEVDKWHWFAVVMSGNTTSANCQIYIDQSFDGSTTLTNLSTTPAADVNRTIGWTLNVEYFLGKISLIQIYNRALSNKEVYKNYHAQKGRFL